MPARVVTETQQTPRQARHLVPRSLPRRGEVLAACMVLAVLAHLLFAQLTIVLAALFALTTKATRWRRSWLIGPVIIGLTWTAAVGLRAAAAGFADGPAKVAAYFGASGHQAAHLLHFNAAFTGLGSWLPRQLPLAILAGAAEAALIGWLVWLHTDERDVPPPRPGLLVAARRAAAARAIRAGGVVSRDGGCLGVMAGTGARVTVSWPEAAGGVAVCGAAHDEVMATGFQLVHAAVRRRKPVLAVDLTADPGLPRQLAAVCAASGVPLQVFGDAGPGWPEPADAWARPACYEPFRRGGPAQRASLVAAMVSWDGPGRQYRRSCLACLEDVFELIDAAPGDPRVPVLDEVIHLMNPTAMVARMEHVPASYPRREVLAERTRASASLLHAEPATTAQLARQLRELRASAPGRWLRPPSQGPAGEIDLGRAATERSVVLFRLGGGEPAGTPGSSPGGQACSAMLARLVCHDLLAAGAALRRIGVDGDAVVWLTECGPMPRRPVTDLIAQGPGTGLPVLAATTSAGAAAELAGLANVVVAHRITDPAAASRIAAAAGGGGGSAAGGELSALRDGEFLLAVKDPPRLVPRGRPVRARIPHPVRARIPGAASDGIPAAAGQQARDRA